MKAVWLVLLISVCSFNVSAKSKGSKKVRYPVVQTLQGQVEQVEPVITVVNREPVISEKQKNLKKGMNFRDKAHFRSKEKSQMRLGLSDSSFLILEENTEIKIPEIAWENGGISNILILKGSLRYVCRANCSRKILTPIFESVPPAGDYIFNYQPEIPQIQTSVLNGELSFRGLENETSIVLKAGEKASFKGVLEDGQPAFDVLLRGRRIAKGQLSDVEKIPVEFTQALAKQEEEFTKALKKAVKTKRLPSQICDKPWGEMNQCAWVCENNKKGAKECRVQEGAKCVRMRCNANGQWSDRMELPASQNACQAQSLVSACNY